jgi:hypothetical protein
VAAFEGLNEFKMATVAMVTKVFSFFCPLVTMATAAIFNFRTPPQKLPHTTMDIPTKFHEV